MIGRDDLITHPDYIDSDKRLENRKSLETIFQSWLDQHTREEIFLGEKVVLFLNISQDSGNRFKNLLIWVPKNARRRRAKKRSPFFWDL